jgi:serine/threonine-protein kinase
MSRRAPATVALLGEAYAANGNGQVAQEILEELAGRRHVSKYFTSKVHAALGQTDAALAMLEAGYREHGEWMMLIKVDSRFDSLRSDPRFQDLMRRMNFPEEANAV